MKSVAMYVSVAVNVILGVCLIMAVGTNTLGASIKTPNAAVRNVARPVTMMKNVGMGAATAGVAMMGQNYVPAQAAQFTAARPQIAELQQQKFMADFGVQAPQLNAEVAEVTPSLRRYFYSLLAAGGVVLGIYGALSAVAKFDKIERS